MITRLFRAMILAVWVFSATSALAATTHYISKSVGSDASNGTTKTTPWAHLPGMISCTGNCASYAPSAGDQFIFKGGDTWVASDLGMIWRWSGTAANPIYIGVDKTWFAGSSWARPVFSCGGTPCAGTGNYANYFWIGDPSGGDYVTIDNLEFTGLLMNGSGAQYITTQRIYDVVENCYFHGWVVQSGLANDTTLLTSFNNNNFLHDSTGSGIFYSAIDGWDTAKNSGHGIGGAPQFVVGNVVQYVANGMDNAGATFVHDNYFGPIVASFQSTAHQNAMSICCTANGETDQFIYNNVITGTTGAICGSVCGGIVKLWTDQFSSPSTVSYIFNNVMFNNDPGNLIAVAGHNAQNYGTRYFLNNTIECGNDISTSNCINDAPAASSVTLYSENNHWISAVAPPAVNCIHWTCLTTTDVLQTVAVARTQGYTSGALGSFSPTTSGGATVAKGTNMQSICGTISGLDAAAGTACQNSTSYACSYNTTIHAVSCPNRTEVARPSTTAWDVGAYMYSTSQAQIPQPPSNLLATVQ